MKLEDNRKYDIGDWVKTKGGTVAEVIGSALYYVFGPCYRLRTKPDAKRTFYRWENEIEKKVIVVDKL